MLAVVDAGPLYAIADLADVDHTACLDTLRRRDLEVVVPALVVAEASYFIASRLGSRAEAVFLRGLRDFHVEAPTPDDLMLMADLVTEYEDFPLGGTDASIVALAVRLGIRTVVTLDRRHFLAIRPPHCEAFDVLPN